MGRESNLPDWREWSLFSFVFRVVLSAVFLLTALGASHAVRYVLLGICLAMILGERVIERLFTKNGMKD